MVVMGSSPESRIQISRNENPKFSDFLRPEAGGWGRVPDASLGSEPDAR